MSDLLPCPFCGGDDDMIRRGDALKIALAYASGEGAALAQYAIRAIPAADARVATHPLSDEARTALEADNVLGWINSLPKAAADARPVQDDAASRRRKLLGYMDDKAAADAVAEAQLCGPADAVTLKPTTTPELVGFLTDAAGIAMKARAEALKEAAALCDTCPDSHWGPYMKARILALIPETKPQAADQREGGK